MLQSPSLTFDTTSNPFLPSRHALNKIKVCGGVIHTLSGLSSRPSQTRAQHLQSPLELPSLLQAGKAQVELPIPAARGVTQLTQPPEQERSLATVLAQFRPIFGTRKPLAPKCQIVVKFLYKKQNFKKLLLVTATRLASTTPRRHAHRQISKFTSSRIREAEPSAHPHPQLEDGLSPRVPLSIFLPVPVLEGAPKEVVRSCTATSSRHPGVTA